MEEVMTKEEEEEYWRQKLKEWKQQFDKKLQSREELYNRHFDEQKVYIIGAFVIVGIVPFLELVLKPLLKLVFGSV
ncbi:MAG: hypothetical protein LBC61_04220 [Candidatus Peribacteria bacterium]|jgi:glycogen debranching enzyme|nr:hypothetical protein [Candidatus Peribacteria bacterium]